MSKKMVPVETSARHVHVSREDLDILYGEGHELIPIKNLSQPGQYACMERLRVEGPKGKLPAVSILGPVRGKTQVEVSLTDARNIGARAPVRESGDIEGSCGCTLIGPKGSVTLEEGVIAAKRHVHITPKQAEEWNLQDRQVVCLKYENPERTIIYDDVIVRVNISFALALHIDTDEANAGAVQPGAFAEILE
ncbi:MAG: phosphate propanoyltransferase [Oscillospiraceae bacterium]|nr:phosphate propanoyltransferase [Oscillospiraceae bacterium]